MIESKGEMERGGEMKGMREGGRCGKMETELSEGIGRGKGEIRTTIVRGVEGRRK